MASNTGFTSEFRHHTFEKPEELQWLLNSLKLNNEISYENVKLSGYNVVIAQLDTIWSKNNRKFIIERYDGTKVLYDELTLRNLYLNNETDDSYIIANLYAKGRELYAMKELKVAHENYKPTTKSILSSLGFSKSNYDKFIIGMINIKQTKMTYGQLYNVIKHAESSIYKAIMVDLNTVAIVKYNTINVYTMQKKVVFNS
jgi:hypothetical protein